MGLDVYRKKRKFTETPEPRGRRRKSGRRLAFVVHKHDARRLHYDVRLELGGVLLSWAVPKGPPRKLSDRRLAVQTEDHPLEYAAFEGRIPAGHYGAGTVEIWDRGTWEPEGDPKESLGEGKLAFRMDGERLHGRFALVRLASSRSGRSGDGRDWLMIKRSDRASAARKAGASKRAGRATARTPRRARPHEARSAAQPKARPRAESRDGAQSVAIAGVELTHPDRVLFPELGVTKRELAEYYASVAEHILPHVADRPLTLVRCPEGPAAGCFYQKHHTGDLPDAIRAIPVQEKSGTRLYVAIDDVTGLIALVQRGVLELHPWPARADRLERPDRIVIDLDPGPGVAWPLVIAAANELRELAHELGLAAFARTSGGKGLHVVLPIERRSSWDDAKAFAQALAEALARRDRERYVLVATKSRRAGRIFLDYLRNARGATSVASYSARAVSGAKVAMPLAWDEVTPRLDPARFDVRSVPELLARQAADPWEGFFDVRQSLTRAILAGAAEL